MNTVAEAAVQALGLVASADSKLVGIVLLSLRVSLAAVVFGCLIGLPLGAAIAVNEFRGRRALIVILNGLMGLPSVVVGLFVYLLLSRAGPLGSWGILFTPTAMVIAQTILITPTIAALSRQVVADAWQEYREQLRSLGETPSPRSPARSSPTPGTSIASSCARSARRGWVPRPRCCGTCASRSRRSCSRASGARRPR